VGYCLTDDGQVLRGEQVITEEQTAIVETFHTWGVVLDATFNQPMSTLHVECRRPVIDGTEFQGGIVATETRNLLITIDDSESEPWPLTAGAAAIPLEFPAPGTYVITVSAEFGCTPAVLEVMIP
jgi:hypothetical protein